MTLECISASQQARFPRCCCCANGDVTIACGGLLRCISSKRSETERHAPASHARTQFLRGALRGKRKRGDETAKREPLACLRVDPTALPAATCSLEGDRRSRPRLAGPLTRRRRLVTTHGEPWSATPASAVIEGFRPRCERPCLDLANAVR